VFFKIYLYICIVILNINYMATLAQKSRKSRALSTLEAQLKSGVKTQKGTKDVKIALTEADRKRINKEIDNLKTKL